MQVSGRGVQHVCEGEVEPRDTRHKAAGILRTVHPCLVVGLLLLWGQESNQRGEVEQPGDGPVLVMHDGATKSIFAHVIPAKRVDFPSCEKVVMMISEDLDNLGYHRVVFRCDNEASILALLGTVKLAWTGDLVQETSAEGDPQSNGAAEILVNFVKKGILDR